VPFKIFLPLCHFTKLEQYLKTLYAFKNQSIMQEKGSISIHTENIFPIIKKFLYSDNEIFLRELVSNAVDATQKLKKLASKGEFNGELGDLKKRKSVEKRVH
jgi:molecular chaperone HtpG